MRISDWSSDVCSSDLASEPWRAPAGLSLLRLQPEPVDGGRPAIVFAVDEVLALRRGLVHDRGSLEAQAFEHRGVFHGGLQGCVQFFQYRCRRDRKSVV